jgi:hypothetical protein
MNAEELRACLAALDLNQSQAAILLQIGRRALRYMANGHEPIPRAVAYALRYLVEHPQVARDFIARHRPVTSYEAGDRL